MEIYDKLIDNQDYKIPPVKDYRNGRGGGIVINSNTHNVKECCH